ncbi:Retrovirus-related Pol polyprotein from transposon opus [Gossypium australe]|uniref:Retrovirus-related Pol polyprotein from transposon opus n=1 Tax=Gossypium australe TaxID=47621 RepID=A0A5B6VD07_9ROSI|nr:Retrovirus-related Pol polyprotein from transposon opus [Gossypium australe]
MDSFSGYNQISMALEDQDKTTFVTDKGLFCYQVMHFGLKNAGVTYQWLVVRIFRKQIGQCIEVYVDNMLVKEAFAVLRAHSMKLNTEKCVFSVRAGKFLGFVISEKLIEVNPEKFHRLTGKVVTLNRFISRMVNKCLPFFKALRTCFSWNEECQEAFDKLKLYLTSPPH